MVNLESRYFGYGDKPVVEWWITDGDGHNLIGPIKCKDKKGVYLLCSMVRAVNCHDRLVECAEELYRCHGKYYMKSFYLDDLLAEAKGGEDDQR